MSLGPNREITLNASGSDLVEDKPQIKILGGENFNDQPKLLARDPHFVVATPGRLADHLKQKHLFLNGLF